MPPPVPATDDPYEDGLSIVPSIIGSVRLDVTITDQDSPGGVRLLSTPFHLPGPDELETT